MVPIIIGHNYNWKAIVRARTYFNANNQLKFAIIHFFINIRKRRGCRRALVYQTPSVRQPKSKMRLFLNPFTDTHINITNI